MTEGQSVIRIGAGLVARKEPDRDAWEIRRAEVVLGRVVRTASGFKALKPSPNGDYTSVGTFVTLETAGRALGQ